MDFTGLWSMIPFHRIDERVVQNHSSLAGHGSSAGLTVHSGHDGSRIALAISGCMTATRGREFRSIQPSVASTRSGLSSCCRFCGLNTQPWSTDRITTSAGFPLPGWQAGVLVEGLPLSAAPRSVQVGVLRPGRGPVRLVVPPRRRRPSGRHSWCGVVGGVDVAAGRFGAADLLEGVDDDQAGVRVVLQRAIQDRAAFDLNRPQGGLAVGDRGTQSEGQLRLVQLRRPGQQVEASAEPAGHGPAGFGQLARP